MYRQLIGAVLGAALAVAGPARAQPVDAPVDNQIEEGSGASRSVIEPDGVTQRLGGRLGLEVGGRVSPGGVHVAGSYLYLLDGPWWFDTGVGFTFGGGSAACFRDREDDFICDHGIAGGFAAEVIASVRRELGDRQGFIPYVRGGVALRLLAFNGDDVLGFGFPLIGSAGFRRPVSDVIAIVAAADLRIGWGALNRDLGIEPQVSFAINGGVEFELE